VPIPFNPKRVNRRKDNPYASVLARMKDRGVVLSGGQVDGDAGLTDLDLLIDGQSLPNVPYIGHRPTDGEQVWAMRSGSSVIAFGDSGMGFVDAILGSDQAMSSGDNQIEYGTTSGWVPNNDIAYDFSNDTIVIATPGVYMFTQGLYLTSATFTRIFTFLYNETNFVTEGQDEKFIRGTGTQQFLTTWLVRAVVSGTEYSSHVYATWSAGSPSIGAYAHNYLRVARIA
jgi:hypothetical protein